MAKNPSKNDVPSPGYRRDRLNPQHAIANPEALVRGALASLARVFQNPDLAVREDRSLQRQMRNDPCVAAPLEARVLSTILADWKIVPEDPENPNEVAEAAAIEKAIRKISGGPNMFRNLSLSIWYGHAAVDTVWGEHEKPIEAVGVVEKTNRTAKAKVRFGPVRWIPWHPDSVLFTFEDDPVVLVNPMRYTGPQDLLVNTTEGPAVKIEGDVRKRVILARTYIEASDYDVGLEAGAAYAGVGIRSRAYWTWRLKQEFLQHCARYTERFGGGLIVGKYPAGNDPAKDAVEKAAKNLFNDTITLVPVGAGDEAEQYGIVLEEPSGQGVDLFLKVLEYLDNHIQKLIQGQELTSDAASTGLGSEVAKAHANTFENIVDMDHLVLGEALTRDLVTPIQEVNFPNSNGNPRFEYTDEDSNAKEYLEAVKGFIEIGGRVASKDVADRLGLREPNEDEDSLGGGSPDGDFLSSFNGAGDDQGTSRNGTGRIAAAISD